MRRSATLGVLYAGLPLALAATAVADDAPKPAPPPESRPVLTAEVERLASASDAKEDEIRVVAKRRSDALPVVPLGHPASRDVIGPEVFEGTSRRDMNALVQLVPAVSTRPYNGGDASAPSFSIRGLPDDGLTEYLLVLIDGVPASPLPYGWSAFSFMPVTPERIHAMEITRGGHAVRYSPNTVGGVLNLVTQPIPEVSTLHAGTTFGSNGFHSEMLSAGGTKDGVGALFTVVDKGGDGYRDDGDFSIQDTSLKLRMDTGHGSWVQANVSYFADAHRSPGGLTPDQYEADRFANSRPQNNFNGYRTLVDVVSHSGAAEHAWLELFGSYSYTARRLHALPEEGPPDAMDNWEDESEALIVGARGTWRCDAFGLRHELHAGLRAQREEIDSWTITHTPFATGVPAELQDREYSLDAFSAHIDDTFHPVEKLTVVLGLRAEWIPGAEGSDELGSEDFDESFSALLPGVDVSYEFSESCAVFANAHRSFRPPQVWGFNFTGAGQSLDFEEGEQCEVGTRVEGPSGISGSLAWWRVDFDDVATFDLGYYQNFGRIVADGIDLACEWDAGLADEDLEGLKLRAAWTHQDSRLREGAFSGNRTPYAWKDKVVLGARWDTKDKWSFAVDMTHVGESFSDEAQSAEDATGFVGRNRSVTFWDARVGKTFAVAENVDLELAAGVTNLFDSERYVHSRGGFFGGGRVAYAPRQSWVSAGVNIRF